MLIQHSAFSVIGKRENNEDYFKIFSLNANNHCFIVCDGVGGHQAGELASKTVADAICNFFSNSTFKHFTKDNILQALQFAHQQLQHTAQQLHQPDMATTLALLAISKHRYIKCWIGDSQIFHYNNHHQFSKINEHSYVNLLIKLGEITPEEALHHPQKNIITKAFAPSSFTTPDFEIGLLKGHHRFLLCTDGFREAFNDNAIQQLLSSDYSLQHIATSAQQQCEHYSSDNATAIFVEVKNTFISNLFHKFVSKF
ncbi:MAG: protein-serine/threonine phosphatase Stp1 [Bacteroidia bacterium]